MTTPRALTDSTELTVAVANDSYRAAGRSRARQPPDGTGAAGPLQPQPLPPASRPRLGPAAAGSAAAAGTPG